MSFCASYAIDPRYAVHTPKKDIEFKKKQSLEWHKDNVENNKFYWYDANKHINWLKNKALRWYENGVTKEKFYFVHSDKELEFTKKKALRWYTKNSN